MDDYYNMCEGLTDEEIDQKLKELNKTSDCPVCEEKPGDEAVGIGDS